MIAARTCVVAGRPHAGKTLLVLNLLRYAGIGEAEFEFVTPQGQRLRRRLTLERARALLVHPRSRGTRCLQQVWLPAGWLLVDTPGLPEGIPLEAALRRAAALTLSALQDAAAVLHVVDAAALGAYPPAAPSPLEVELWRYGARRSAYLLVANKVDLPWARAGLELLRRFFPAQAILPVSALYGTGVQAVLHRLFGVSGRPARLDTRSRRSAG